MPEQPANSVPAGIESLVHELLSVLDNHEDWAVADLDAKHAYGNIKLQDALKAFFQIDQFKSAFHIMHWYYCAPVPMFVTDKTGEVVDKIVFMDGFRQGCGMGLLGYCVAVLALYKALANKGPDVRVFGCVDNLSVAGPLRVLKPTVDEYFSAAPSTGTVVSEKSRLRIPKQSNERKEDAEIL